MACNSFHCKASINYFHRIRGSALPGRMFRYEVENLAHRHWLATTRLLPPSWTQVVGRITRSPLLRNPTWHLLFSTLATLPKMAHPLRSTTQMPLRPRSRSPVSRPTTPLRASSRSSFRASSHGIQHGNRAIFNDDDFPLDALEPQFAELSDSMANLEANLMHLQLMHESLSRFGESFASFLYGLNMNAFVVDFPEVRHFLLSTASPCLG